jgi:hypothetical protein
MEDLYNPISDSPKGTQKEKDDPEKMDKDNTICKNPVEHLLNEPQINTPVAYHIIQFFPRKRLSSEGRAANPTWADKKGWYRGGGEDRKSNLENLHGALIHDAPPSGGEVGVEANLPLRLYQLP